MSVGFTVFTLFPAMFGGILGESILKRAIEMNLVDVDLVNFRDCATDKHKTVDDYPFGGGAGMLLKPDPIYRAMKAQEEKQGQMGERILLLSPQGTPFHQGLAVELAQSGSVWMLCGHYEGFDERIRGLVTDEVSVGDFVLTGGEIPAMAILDAVVRLLPGALGNTGSADDDSFSSGLLEYPQYTRPAQWNGQNVPDILMSGHHANVAAWRHRHALYRTWKRRPDLLKEYPLSDEDRAYLKAWEAGEMDGIDVL